MVLLAEPLCKSLYGNVEAGKWLRYYAMMVPMLYCDAITDAMTKGLGQQKACVRYNILTSALDVIFLFLLLPKYGMAGYFVSFLVTHVLNFGLSLRRLLKTANMRIRIVPPLLASFAGVMAVVLGFGFDGVVRLVAFCAAFFAFLCLFRVVGKEDAAWLRGLIQRK